jgi:hypothetical protein
VPLFKGKTVVEERMDSVKKTYTVERSFDYFSLRKVISAIPVFMGEMAISRTYDSSGTLIRKQYLKKSHRHMVDGTLREYWRIIEYDSAGHLKKLHKKIFQNLGTGGRPVKIKTKYYHNGKKVKVVDQMPEERRYWREMKRKWRHND